MMLVIDIVMSLGMVLGSILCSQNQRKVVIFSSTSMASVHATADLLDGTYCDIDVLAQYIIDSESKLCIDIASYRV